MDRTLHDFYEEPDGTYVHGTSKLFGAASNSAATASDFAGAQVQAAIASFPETLINKNIEVIARPGGPVIVPDGPATLATYDQLSGATPVFGNYTASGTGAVVRSFLQKCRDIVSPEDFGCLGDNATNDTVNLQKAFSSGARMVIGRGTYVVNANVILPAGVTLVGVKIRNTNTSGINVLTIGTGCRLYDVEVEGSNAIGIVERLISPSADGVSDVILENVIVSKATFCIHLRPISSTACARWRINAYAHDVVGVNGGSEGYGILMESATDCDVRLIAKTIKRHALYLSAGARRNICDLIVDGCENYAVQLYSMSAQPETSYNTVRMKATNLTTSVAGQSGACGIIQKAHYNTVIIDCVGGGTALYGVAVEGASAGPYPTGNRIVDGNYTGQFTGAEVIRLLNADGTVVANNVIDAYGTFAVIAAIRQGTNGAAHGGFITDNRINAQGQAIRGIYNECNSQPSMILLNDIQNNSSGTKIDDQTGGQAVIRYATRETLWTPMTGTSNKNSTYDTATVTLPQLAGRVMALQAALTTHGIIGS